MADLHVKSAPLKACVIEGDVIPRLIDEIPILAIAAAFAQGTTVIKDAQELRVKESDRITAMATQLSAMGARVSERPDGLEITGGATLTGAQLDSFGDHRIAMSLAIAALAAKGMSEIASAESASISYPDFTQTLTELLGE